VLAVQAPYVDAIQQAGGAPVLIPLRMSAGALAALAARLDGLLLPGGVDIEPVRYGAPRHPKVKRVDPQQDETELILTRWALAHDLPILAICRGAQLLNVAAGGALWQDIPSECLACLQHNRFHPPYPLDETAHPVEIKADSRLSALLGACQIGVNSRHHQALRDLGSGLVITAHAPDGIIEGIEAPGRRFVVAVQWHPENLCDVQPAMRSLFHGFVEAAGRTR